MLKTFSLYHTVHIMVLHIWKLLMIKDIVHYHKLYAYNKGQNNQFASKQNV